MNSKRRSKKLEFSLIATQAQLVSVINSLLDDDDYYARFKSRPYEVLHSERIMIDEGRYENDFIQYLLSLRDLAIHHSLLAGLPIIRVEVDIESAAINPAVHEMVYESINISIFGTNEFTTKKSKSALGAKNNFDNSSSSEVNYESSSSTEAGYKSTAKKGTDSGTISKFGGLTFNPVLIENFNKWALVRPEILEELYRGTFDYVERMDPRTRFRP